MELSSYLDLPPVTSPALAQLRQLQKSLYEKAFKEAHSIVGGTSRTILAYSAKFERSLPERFTRTTQADLQEALRHHRFVLYGDFHTLRQSQRGLLRLLRSYVERQRSGKVLIALEMFKAIDQDFLDGYLAGRMPESEFLASVNYANDWGFPWANFKMILDFARSFGLPVVGINTENAGRDGLQARDRFAARCLTGAAAKYPEHKIVCMIGEYHLADSHLPKALAEEARRQGLKSDILRILNNVDHYYFALGRGGTATASTEYLKLRKSFYCIMNSPPWMKWQSFSLWEEMRYAGQAPALDQIDTLAQGFDDYTEDGFDVDYQFLHFVRNLAGFLDLEVDASDVENFHIHFSPAGDFYRETGAAGLGRDEADRLIARAGIDGAFYLAKTNTVLLTDVSINNLAEAAGQYLHAYFTGFDDIGGQARDEFYRRILKAAVGIVASKILNPRRKCPEMHHLRQFIRRQKDKRLKGPAELKRQTAAAVLRFDRWMDLKIASASLEYASPPRGIVTLDLETNYQVSRTIGQMLGFTLYKKVVANKEPATKLRRLFKRSTPSAKSVWKELTSLYCLMG